MALPKLPGLEDVKNLGVGLAKGVGELATAPGYLADLITKHRGFEVENAEEVKQKSQEWEKLTKPIGKIQQIGHAIGSLNPGTELLSPELEKLGMPSKVAFGIGLGIDVLTPGPGEVGKVKKAGEAIGRAAKGFIPASDLVKKTVKYEGGWKTIIEQKSTGKEIVNIGSSPEYGKQILKEGYRPIRGTDEAIEGKIGEYSVIHQGNKIKKVQGEPVKIFDDVDTFVHKDENGNWAVSEATTGRNLTGGGYENKNFAIKAARENLDALGETKLRKLISENQLPKSSKVSTPDLHPLTQEAQKMNIMPLDQAIKKFDATGSVTIASRPGARLIMKDEGDFVKVGMDFGEGKLIDTELAKTLPEKTFRTKEEAFDFIRNLSKPKIAPELESLAIEARKYKTVSESKSGVRYSEETKDKAIQLYKEGRSSTEISKELGVSGDSVLSWTEKAGIKRTISQSTLLYEKDIPKVIELYKQGKNTTEISKELNLAPSSVARWVKEAGITRSNSEVQSILAEMGKTNVLGVRSKVSTKFGSLNADSTYEAIRIKQLEADPNVIGIKRATRIPLGDNRHYIPDIEIKYKDGSTVIEEIKPVYKLGDEKIIAKEKAARGFLKDKNIEYRIISENDIGIDAFKNANINDFTFGSEEIKSRFANAIKKAQSKTKSQLTDFYNQATSKVSVEALPKTEELAKAKNIAKKLPPLPQLESGKIPQVSKALPPSIPPSGGNVNKLFDDSVAKLTEVLKRAEPIRGEITQLQSEARSLRVGEAAKAQEAVGGERGYYTALSKLKGKLVPEDKIVFQSIRRELGDVDVENIFKKIQTQPDFTFFDKLDSQTAFTKLLKGEIPTEGEINLLRRVFPKETINALLSKRPLIQKIADAGYQIINLPRTIMSGLGDFSASFRQGVFFVAGRPKRFFNAFFSQFKYFVSEKSFNALMKEIKSRPNYELMREYKLALTDLDTITSREEKIMANWGEKIPLIGRAIRATGRAYTGFLNKMRADVFDDLIKKGTAMNRNINEYGPSLARYINSATGRGSLGMFERSAKLLNGVFFSPRLMASRINLMNPVYYARLDPFIRKEALKDLFAFVSTGLTILGLAKLYGPEVKVGWDWRSSDFGKIKIGKNTRIDIWGGFQQYARMFGQLWTGEYVSSTTGKVTTLGEGYKPLTRFDILLRQFETKEAPVASLITNLLRGQDFAGKKINVPDEIGKRFIPMILGDIYDLSQNDPDLVPLSLLSVFGVGVQSYKPTLKPGGALFKGGLPSGRLPGQQRLPSLPGL